MRAFGLCLFLFYTVANASTITFASLSTTVDPNQTNSSGLNTIPIAKNPAWSDPLAGSQWVSYGITGDPSAPGYFVVPNGTVVTFTQSFFLTGSPVSGFVSAMADDSTSVILNGITLMNEATQVGNTYARCSDFQISCVSPTTVSLTPALQSGLNTLQFQVAQRHLASFGLDYSGSASSTATPEPSSLLLLGFGVMGLGSALRQKMRHGLS
jgi:hypothetical protein